MLLGPGLPGEVPDSVWKKNSEEFECHKDIIPPSLALIKTKNLLRTEESIIEKTHFRQ
jgi:hypothetical protein